MAKGQAYKNRKKDLKKAKKADEAYSMAIAEERKRLEQTVICEKHGEYRMCDVM